MDLKRIGSQQKTVGSMRMVLMLGLFLAVAGAFVWLQRGERAASEQVPIDTGVVSLDYGSAPPAAVIDRELLSEVRDGTEAERIVREPEPFLHLLFECGKLVPGDFRRMSAEFLDDASFERILADPASHRGLPFVAKARFLFASEEKIPLDDTLFSYWRGIAADDLGRTWSFSVLERPENVSAGDVIKIEGFFFKKMALFDPADPTRLIDPTLHLVGKRVVKSFLRMPPVRELSPAIFSRLRDYEIQDRLAVPDEALWHVLSYLQGVDADALAAAAEESVDERTGEASYLTTHALTAHPDQYRGAPVRILGSVSRDQPPWPKPLGPDGENPLDLPVIWNSLLVHRGPSFTYLVSAERPPEWIAGNATVIVEGIFLQLYTYQALNRQTVTCPLVVVKRFVPLRIQSEGLRSTVSWALIGISAPLIVLFLVFAMNDRRAAEELRRRRSERRGARGGASGSTASPA